MLFPCPLLQLGSLSWPRTSRVASPASQVNPHEDRKGSPAEAEKPSQSMDHLQNRRMSGTPRNMDGERWSVHRPLVPRNGSDPAGTVWGRNEPTTGSTTVLRERRTDLTEARSGRELR
ncbi:unnamed protein product [Durusdinium trenchii]|uniref:Secreted protein n=1 Tax=Durusdinium trenchii TaxID=1381693 RepID=A0ABP0RLT0_9DINO